MKKNNFAEIQNRIFRVTKCNFDGNIDYIPAEHLSVELRDNKAVIHYDCTSSISRGLMLLSIALSKGVTTFNITQKRHFKDLGVMLDVSRNGVLTLDAIKDMIDRLSALGFTFLMLYTEDLYTLDNYPSFGYMRGKYSHDDLKCIDEYAYEMGLELIPCIQTLGHLDNFLQWDTSKNIKDTTDCLYIGKEETYNFISEQIKTANQCFRSKRLHIGLDEAQSAGLGQLLLDKGYQDRFKMFNGHLKKVVELCSGYDYEIIMWSDMFFKLGSTSVDYTTDFSVPQNILDDIPNVNLCYWDYYKTDELHYKQNLESHKIFNRPISFAGGNWTWGAFLPHTIRTKDTLLPALKVCVEEKVNMVFSTAWGDDGAETNLMLAVANFAYLSEYCYYTKECTEENINDARYAVSPCGPEILKCFECFYVNNENDNPGKGLVYCDLYFDLLANRWDLNECIANFKKALDLIKDSKDAYATFCNDLFKLCIKKAEVIKTLRASYVIKDRKSLDSIANYDIAILIELYENLIKSYKFQRHLSYKRYGWELHCHRFGGIIERLKYVRENLNEYINNEVTTIEELEETPLNITRRNDKQSFNAFAIPYYNMYN